ncbi:MAG: hypothetical protein E6Q97_39010 [Desulfurellales bacterium]|nr:MAG: hypothetical protein E6Q97_39010 [Desulfurellales bacterium]
MIELEDSEWTLKVYADPLTMTTVWVNVRPYRELPDILELQTGNYPSFGLAVDSPKLHGSHRAAEDWLFTQITIDSARQLLQEPAAGISDRMRALLTQLAELPERCKERGL